MLISLAALAAGAVLVIFLYRRGYAVTKCIAAVLFVFLPGKNRDRVTLDSCTGWVRHAGQFREGRVYEFRFRCQMSSGDAEVSLLDGQRRELLRLNRQRTKGRIELDQGGRFYLRWEFKSATGSCELCWQEP